MDPTILTTWISGGAALLGAVLGATGTIASARLQHKLTAKSERRKESRLRMQTAAEKCRAFVEEQAKLETYQPPRNESEEDFIAREHEIDRLRKELASEILYLPSEAQDRIRFATRTLDQARDLMNYGLFYRRTSTVAQIVVDDTNLVLAAVVRDGEVPEPNEEVRHLRIAMDELGEEKAGDLAEEIGNYEEEKRRWIEARPQAQLPAPASGRLAQLRRRFAPGSKGN